MRNPIKFSTLLSSLVAGLLVFCLSSLSLASSPVLTRVTQDKVLKVGMSAGQPPFNMRARDKSLMGFDVDLALAMADAMRVKLEIVEIPFGQLLSNLEAGKVDMVISGVTITPERARSVSFVGPYTLSGKSILTTAAIKSVVTDGTEFNSPDIRVVALENSTSELFVQRNMPEASLNTIANYNEGIQALLTGQIDAMVADVPILRLSLLQYPNAGLGMLEPALQVEPIGIAVPRGDKQYEHLVRNYLAAFEQMGVIARLYEKWFENDSWIAALP